MVKRLLLITLIALLLLAGGLAVGLWWLLNTEAGVRWLLAGISSRSVVTVEAEAIEGRLLDRLRLTGVRVVWPQGEARLDSVQLQWRPRRLLAGHLAIEELSASGGEVTWSTPPAGEAERGPAFAWPRMEGWPLRMRGSVEALRIEGIELHPPEGESQKLELVARLEWHDGLLIVSGLETAAAGYRLEGSGEAGFDQPRLRLDLRLRLPSAAAGMDGLSLQSDLSAVADDAFAGPLEVRGLAGSELRLHLKAEVEGGGDWLRLRRFELTRPGRRGTLNGEGEVRLGGEAPRWSLRATVADLDLGPETEVKTDLAGTLEAAGTGPKYRGSFELTNRTPGWRFIRLSGPFAGNAQGIDLPKLDGSWLRGTLAGDLRLAWKEGFTLAGGLKGRRLDPSVFTPQWPGRINLDLSGDLARPATGPMTARLRGRLLESTLRGRALTGAVEADLAGKDLRLAVFELHGDGFDFSAHGRLAERIDYRAEIARLSGLVPGAKGAFTAQGWLRWRGGELAGALDGQGRQLAYGEYRIGALKLYARLPGGNQPGTIAADGSGLAFGRWRLQTAGLNLSGSLRRHAIDLRARWSQGELRMAAAGGWRAPTWKGTLQRLEGQDAGAGPWRLTEPAGLEISADRLRISTLRLAGRGSEWLEFGGEAVRGPWRGSAEAKWESLELSRANSWLTGMKLDGRSSGGVRGRFQQDGSLELSGKVTAEGRLKRKEMELSVQNAEAAIDWNAKGLLGTLTVELKEGGRLSGRVTSKQPGRLDLPERGSIEVDWTDLDLARLHPWTPQELDLAGRIEGSAKGDWLPGRKLAISGETGVEGGRLSWKTEDGVLQADLRTARLDWEWRGETLAGELALELAEYGAAKGTFRLPLPARLPTSLNPAGPLRLDLSANAREQGLLGAFFPGVVRESRGELELRLQAGGTWSKPDLAGHARLAKAGAYFPAAGIELKEVALDASLSGDEVRVESLTAQSGPGRLTGSGTVRLKNWRPDSYRAHLKGSRFEVVHLPELQMTVSPDLTLNGTAKRLEVRGEVRVPELTVTGREREVVRESPDVVIVGAAGPAERPLPMGLDIRVHIILGDHVLVKTAGVDARLEGELDLRIAGPETMTGRGEIKVAQGTYSTYGVKLKIVRGRMLYSGGPIDQPTLDILALRTVGEVKAGVQVGGTPRSPVVKLYSEPAMPDTDILAYIVLGSPMGEETGQAGVLTSAAAALLSRGESAVLQDRIKRRLGVDVLEVESGGGDVAASMVTVGKYLSPKLYLSFGRSLFTGTTETRLRYTISKKWELESKAGAEATGVDLFYKIEFK